MTLLEVLFATAILTLAVGGLFATFLQSRRLTEGSVYQNAALTIVQGYIEQIKNMELGQMLGSTTTDASGNPIPATGSYVIPVYYDKNTPDSLKTSTGTPPTITAINSGATPTGAQDNLAYSDNERFTLASTEKGLDAWRTAKTDQEVAVAAARMERILILLAKVMRRCEKGVPAPEPNQVDSSALFLELEQQRQQSRIVTTELVLRYNAVVETFNDKVLGAPGSWIAGLAGLHPRHPLFSSGG